MRNLKKTEKIPIDASDIADGRVGIVPDRPWKWSKDKTGCTKRKDTLATLVPEVSEPEIEGKVFDPVEEEVERGWRESEKGREERRGFVPIDKGPEEGVIGGEREGSKETELVSVEPDAEAGGAVPEPPAARDSCAKPTEGGSARKTE